MWFQAKFNKCLCPELIQANAGMKRDKTTASYQYFNSILSIKLNVYDNNSRKADRKQIDEGKKMLVYFTTHNIRTDNVWRVCVVQKRYVFLKQTQYVWDFGRFIMWISNTRTTYEIWNSLKIIIIINGKERHDFKLNKSV